MGVAVGLYNKLHTFITLFGITYTGTLKLGRRYSRRFAKLIRRVKEGPEGMCAESQKKTRHYGFTL